MQATMPPIAAQQWRAEQDDMASQRRKRRLWRRFNHELLGSNATPDNPDARTAWEKRAAELNQALTTHQTHRTTSLGKLDAALSSLPAPALRTPSRQPLHGMQHPVALLAHIYHYERAHGGKDELNHSLAALKVKLEKGLTNEEKELAGLRAHPELSEWYNTNEGALTEFASDDYCYDQLDMKIRNIPEQPNEITSGNFEKHLWLLAPTPSTIKLLRKDEGKINDATDSLTNLSSAFTDEKSKQLIDQLQHRSAQLIKLNKTLRQINDQTLIDEYERQFAEYSIALRALNSHAEHVSKNDPGMRQALNDNYRPLKLASDYFATKLAGKFEVNTSTGLMTHYTRQRDGSLSKEVLRDDKGNPIKATQEQVERAIHLMKKAHAKEGLPSPMRPRYWLNMLVRMPWEKGPSKHSDGSTTYHFREEYKDSFINNYLKPLVQQDNDNKKKALSGQPAASATQILKPPETLSPNPTPPPA